jgi:hypothetical protein
MVVRGLVIKAVAGEEQLEHHTIWATKATLFLIISYGMDAATSMASNKQADYCVSSIRLSWIHPSIGS